jgi:26S proteasome regulatory subunit N8
VALSGLKERLMEMDTYLQNVLDGKLSMNNQIIYNIQTIFNLLPNLNVEHLVRSMFVKTNDFYMVSCENSGPHSCLLTVVAQCQVIYLSALIRSVIALHDLVNNKIKYKETDDEENSEKKDKEKKAKADGQDKKGEGKDSATPAQKKD